MSLIGLIIAVVVGGAIGFVANNVMKGGLGQIGDIVVGIVGALVAGFLLPRIGIAFGGGYVGAVLIDAVGAVAAVVGTRFIRR